MFCTAAPEAPLPRLSKRAESRTFFLIAKDEDVQIIGIVTIREGHITIFQALIRRIRHDPDKLLPGIIFRQCRPYLRSA